MSKLYKVELVYNYQLQSYYVEAENLSELEEQIKAIKEIERSSELERITVVGTKLNVANAWKVE